MVSDLQCVVFFQLAIRMNWQEWTQSCWLSGFTIKPFLLHRKLVSLVTFWSLTSLFPNLKTMVVVFVQVYILLLREEWFYSLVKITSFSEKLSLADKPNRGDRAKVVSPHGLSLLI